MLNNNGKATPTYSCKLVICIDDEPRVAYGERMVALPFVPVRGMYLRGHFGTWDNLPAEDGRIAKVEQVIYNMSSNTFEVNMKRDYIGKCPVFRSIEEGMEWYGPGWEWEILNIGD